MRITQGADDVIHVMELGVATPQGIVDGFRISKDFDYTKLPDQRGHEPLFHPTTKVWCYCVKEDLLQAMAALRRHRRWVIYNEHLKAVQLVKELRKQLPFAYKLRHFLGLKTSFNN